MHKNQVFSSMHVISMLRPVMAESSAKNHISYGKIPCTYPGKHRRFSYGDLVKVAIMKVLIDHGLTVLQSSYIAKKVDVFAGVQKVWNGPVTLTIDPALPIKYTEEYLDAWDKVGMGGSING